MPTQARVLASLPRTLLEDLVMVLPFFHPPAMHGRDVSERSCSSQDLVTLLKRFSLRKRFLLSPAMLRPAWQFPRPDYLSMPCTFFFPFLSVIELRMILSPRRHFLFRSPARDCSGDSTCQPFYLGTFVGAFFTKLSLTPSLFMDFL